MVQERKYMVVFGNQITMFCRKTELEKVNRIMDGKNFQTYKIKRRD